MRLAEMTVENGIAVSEELARKCDEALPLAQEFQNLAAQEYAVDQVLTAIGVFVGQNAKDIEVLKVFFLTMEHAAVASFANKHAQRVMEN